MAKKETASSVPNVHKTLPIKYHISNLLDKYSIYEILKAIMPKYRNEQIKWIEAFKKIIKENE